MYSHILKKKTLLGNFCAKASFSMRDLSNEDITLSVFNFDQCVTEHDTDRNLERKFLTYIRQ